MSHDGPRTGRDGKQLTKFLSLWKFLAQMGSWACSLPQSLAMEGDVAPEEEDLLLSI